MSFLTLERKIAQQIQLDIEAGKYKEGEALPSERELATIFNVQRMTIRAALKRLVHGNLIVAKDRSGYYVAKPRYKLYADVNAPGGDILSPRGKALMTKLISFEIIEANKSLSTKLKIPIGTKLNKIKRLRFENEQNIALESGYVAEDTIPSIIKYDLEKNSIYDILVLLGHEFKQIIHRYDVVYTNEEEKKHLGYSLQEPLIKQKITYYDKNENKLLAYAGVVIGADKVEVVNDEW